MQQQNEMIDALDIAGLEYDVGGMGSEEGAGAETNHAAHYLVSYLVPQQQG